MRARRKFVNKTSEHFLARPTLTQQKHWDFDIRNQRRLRANLLHRRTSRNKKYVVAKFFDFAGVALTLRRANALPNDRIEFGLLKRLGQIIHSPQPHGLHHLARVIHAGEHYDFQSGLQLAQLLQSLQAVNARHKQIEQYQVWVKALLDALHRLFAGARRLHFMLIHFQKRANVSQHSRFIIHQQDVGGFAHLVPRGGVLTIGLIGIRKENLQPAPGSLSTQILPLIPCSNLRAMASPSPIPSADSLPGRRKKSSNISRWNSGRIPGPVSATLTFTELGRFNDWRRRSLPVDELLTLRRSHI